MSDEREQQLEKLVELAGDFPIDNEGGNEVRLPVAGLVYLRYLDEDGQSWMRYRFIGEQELSTTIGDLERIKASYIRDRDADE